MMQATSTVKLLAQGKKVSRPVYGGPRVPKPTIRYFATQQPNERLTLTEVLWSAGMKLRKGMNKGLEKDQKKEDNIDTDFSDPQSKHSEIDPNKEAREHSERAHQNVPPGLRSYDTN